MKQLLKYGRQGNLMAYFFDYAMPYISRIENWMKSCILKITMDYRGITLTVITDKIHNAWLLDHVQPEVEKVLGKNWNFSDSDYLSNHQRNMYKNHEATLFVDFSNTTDSIQRRKMEQILLVHGFSKETVTSIMMLYKNMKIIVYSPDGVTDFFDIVTRVVPDF